MTRTLTFRAVFGQQRDARPARRAVLAPSPPTMPIAGDADAGPPVSRLARQLALAYKVRQLLDDGVLPDQREAAARLGIVFPQMTHIMNLLYLSPDIQERILSGELVVGEAVLRAVARLPGWEQQRRALPGRRQAQSTPPTPAPSSR